jgi:hypothetical protein
MRKDGALFEEHNGRGLVDTGLMEPVGELKSTEPDTSENSDSASNGRRL